MASWKSQRRSTNIRRSQQQTTWHCDLHARLSRKALVSMGIHSQAGWKGCTQRQWCLQSHDLQSDHRGRSSHTRNTDYSCLKRLMNMGRPVHHSADCLKERGVDNGSGRNSTSLGGERSLFNQTNIGTVSRAALETLLRDGAKRI